MEPFRFDEVRTSWDSPRGQHHTADWLLVHMFTSMVVTQYGCPRGQPCTADWLPIHMFTSMVVTVESQCQGLGVTQSTPYVHIAAKNSATPNEKGEVNLEQSNTICNIFCKILYPIKSKVKMVEGQCLGRYEVIKNVTNTTSRKFSFTCKWWKASGTYHESQVEVDS